MICKVCLACFSSSTVKSQSCNVLVKKNYTLDTFAGRIDRNKRDGACYLLVSIIRSTKNLKLLIETHIKIQTYHTQCLPKCSWFSLYLCDVLGSQGILVKCTVAILYCMVN